MAAMLVITIEFWPAGDPRRAVPHGWIAALTTRTAGPPLLVVSSLQGRREVRFLGDSASDVLNILKAVATDAPDSRNWDPPTARAVRDVTRLLDIGIDGQPPPRSPHPGAAAAAIDPRPGQRCGARDRVLALRHLSDAQVEDMFPGVRDRAAIVRGLRKSGVLLALRHKGSRLYPAFQFNLGRPDPVVAHVNLLLEADRNPWAAATWWANHDSLLGVTPVSLLGHPDGHDRLLARATARATQRPTDPGTRIAP